MLRFRSGDREAFDTLFRRYTPRLVTFLARMVRDRDRAEELAQEAFVRIFLARDRYEPKARFSTWIFGIASNLALNDLGRAYRRRERPLDAPAAGSVADPAPSAEEALEAKEKARGLEEAIGALPDRQRAALLLRVEQGLGYEEIGEALGATVHSVKSLIHRARTALLDSTGGRES